MRQNMQFYACAQTSTKIEAFMPVCIILNIELEKYGSIPECIRFAAATFRFRFQRGIWIFVFRFFLLHVASLHAFQFRSTETGNRTFGNMSEK